MTDAAIANLVHAVHAARSDAKAARAALADATSDGAAIAALTAERIADTAVDHLHARLNDIPGHEFDRPWAQEAVETLRRGEPLEIQSG